MLRNSDMLDKIIEQKKSYVGKSNAIAVPLLQAAIARAKAESEAGMSPSQASNKAFEQERVAKVCVTRALCIVFSSIS